MYHTDTTATRRIDAYTMIDGLPRDRRTLTTISAGDLDGLCIDDAGAIWVALWDGAAVHRYTLDGRLDTIVEVPATRPTSCAFAEDLLYITTARGWPPPQDLARHPLSGSLFVCSPGVTGPAATPWNG